LFHFSGPFFSPVPQVSAHLDLVGRPSLRPGAPAEKGDKSN
jgi:hypothetical protein